MLTAASVVALFPTSASAAGELALVSQDFNLNVDGTFRFVVELPDGLTVAGLPNATLVVNAYRAVSSREAVAAAQEGTLPRSADSVDLPLAQLARPTATSVQGFVQLESLTRTPEKLQLSQPGLYPVTLEVRDGNRVVAELITFVNRLADATTTANNNANEQGDLRVALAMETTKPVQLNAAGDVVMNAEAIDELSHLAGVLDALRSADVPATISVPPAWLGALADNGQVELADRLAAGLAPHDLLSAPSLPLDASQAADAGQQTLFTQWLRDGDDILASVVDKPSVRTITFVDSPLDQGGASLHRDLGSRLLVITPNRYDELPDSLGSATDTTRLVTIEVAPGVRMDATIPDRHSSDLLATVTDRPALTAVLLVADLLAARQELIDDEVNPSHRGITLATPDLSLPPTATLAATAALLANTPGLNATTLDDLGLRTDQLSDDGDLVLVRLPTTVGGSLATRLAPVATIAAEAASTASMLPATDSRLSEWTTALGQLATSALTDAQVTSILADLQQQFLAIRNSVEIPQGFSFTLTGRTTTVPIKLHNVSDTPLTVRVRMTSSKLLFPGGDQTVTLPPQAFFDVEISIEVRSNGRFPVTLEVFTPKGDLHLTAPIRLLARVNAIGGLANLITGALLLVVITWWARHNRKKRRRRAAHQASLNHPLRGVGESNETESSNLPAL
ncbi:hypothetical protein BH10ACT2_BH10ACT2_13960 [soil metagenome]